MRHDIIPYDAFQAIDGIRRSLGIQNAEWAAASGIGSPPRISELRSQVKGRPLTYEKIVKLVEGLKRLRGEKVVRREMLRVIRRMKRGQTRLVLMAVI